MCDTINRTSWIIIKTEDFLLTTNAERIWSLHQAEHSPKTDLTSDCCYCWMVQKWKCAMTVSLLSYFVYIVFFRFFFFFFFFFIWFYLFSFKCGKCINAHTHNSVRMSIVDVDSMFSVPVFTSQTFHGRHAEMWKFCSVTYSYRRRRNRIHSLTRKERKRQRQKARINFIYIHRFYAFV